MHAHMHTCMHTHTHARTHTHTQTVIHTDTDAHVHTTCTHAHIYTALHYTMLHFFIYISSFCLAHTPDACHFVIFTGSGLAITSISMNETFCATGSEDGFLRLWPLDFAHVYLEAGEERMPVVEPVKDHSSENLYAV